MNSGQIINALVRNKEEKEKDHEKSVAYGIPCRVLLNIGMLARQDGKECRRQARRTGIDVKVKVS